MENLLPVASEDCKRKGRRQQKEKSRPRWLHMTPGEEREQGTVSPYSTFVSNWERCPDMARCHSTRAKCLCVVNNLCNCVWHPRGKTKNTETLIIQELINKKPKLIFSFLLRNSPKVLSRRFRATREETVFLFFCKLLSFYPFSFLSSSLYYSALTECQVLKMQRWMR